jgi:hypothetical protein
LRPAQIETDHGDDVVDRESASAESAHRAIRFAGTCVRDVNRTRALPKVTTRRSGTLPCHKTRQPSVPAFDLVRAETRKRFAIAAAGNRFPAARIRKSESRPDKRAL